MAKEPAIVKTHVQKKDFSYTKGNVQLSFTLRVDNSSELRPFRDLLAEALKDVDEVVATLKN